MAAAGSDATIASSTSPAESATIALRIVVYDAVSSSLPVEPRMPGPSGARSASMRTVMGSEISASHRWASRLNAANAFALPARVGAGLMTMSNVPRFDPPLIGGAA